MVQCILYRAQTLIATRTLNVILHKVSEGTRFAGTQTIGVLETTMVISVDTVGEIPSTNTLSVFLGIRAAVGKQNFSTLAIGIKWINGHNKIPPVDFEFGVIPRLNTRFLVCDHAPGIRICCGRDFDRPVTGCYAIIGTTSVLLGAMWQMIMVFFYREFSFENHHNYLPHCPSRVIYVSGGMSNSEMSR